MASRNGRRARLAEPVRVAVVGVGYWGPNLVRVLHELDCASASVVCDRDEAALTAVAKRYPGARLTQSFESVLVDDEIEAVVIATPVSTHYALAATALDAGKHVFVEKPMAGSLEEAEDLIERAESSDLTLMPGHTFLYSPPVTMVRDLIQSGELGEIYFISTSRVNLGLHQRDVSVIWDLGPHDFSILRYWLDEAPIAVSATGRACVVPGIPDVAFVGFEFASGTVAHVELSWLAPSKLRRTAVVGSKKMVVYDDTSNEPVRVFDSGVMLPDPQNFGEYRLTYRSGDIVSPRVDVTEPLAVELADFCSAVRSGESPRSSMELGRDVVRIAELADRSLSQGGGRISLQPPLPPAARASAR
jgi:predicted dehydrogenase